MSMDAQDVLLLAGGGGFAVYLLAKMLGAMGMQHPRFEPARKALSEAKRKARDRSASASERAAALREAATVALEGLQRPTLAASYARRAEKLDPKHPASASLLATALRRGTRYRALELLLWRQLADHPVASVAYERAFQELVTLYEGPLRRPETATVLRRLASTASSPAV